MHQNIIPISSAPIRKKWLSRYHEIERRLSKLKREWNLFETEAQNSYQQWYHRTFARTISDLKSVGEEIHELQLILSAVDAQREVNGLSKRAALEYVLNAVSNKQDPFPDREQVSRHEEEKKRIYEQQFKLSHGVFGGQEIDPEILERAKYMVYAAVRRQYPAPPQDPWEIQRLQQEIDRAIHEVYERLLHQKSDFDEEEVRQEARPKSRVREEQDPGARTRISEEYKVLYRKIVKRLHPDRGEEMSEEEKLLWTEAQRAYLARDEEALRTLLLRVEGGGLIQIHRVESIGEIIDVTVALHREYEEIQFYQRRTKKEWVYRHWASRKHAVNRKKLDHEIQSHLNQQLFRLRDQMKGLAAELNQLKRSFQRR